MNAFKRYKLIACEIMFREVCFCAAQCKNRIDVTFMPKGLHDVGESKMSQQLQMEIDKVDASRYEAILLCYGLCNNGIRGLNSSLPMIIPRAHDCITLLLGSRDKYKKHFDENPGTFYKSTGWIERDTHPNDAKDSVTSQLGMNKTYKEYVEQYGEENAKYLMEMLGDWMKNYNKIAYIDTQVGDFDAYKALARQQADENQWEYEELQGDTNILHRLLSGEWNDRDFLIIPPHHQIEPTHTEELISYIPVSNG